MNQITDESYIDLIIDNNLVSYYQKNATNVYPLNPKMSLLPIEQSKFHMDIIGEYPYAYFPSLFTLSSDICRNSNIEKIQSHPNFSLYGQGTMLAGIIGGEDTEQNYQGIVPSCNFIIVKLKPAKLLNKKVFCVPEDKLCYEESDVISALSFVTATARQLHKPLSVLL